MKISKQSLIWVLLRFAMGWTMLWAFLDKLWGLGFATPAAKSWVSGASPTLGYLKSAAGPLGSFYQGIAGHPVVDFLFMFGLAAVGVALLLGVGVRIAAYSGALMMLLMLSSHFPPTQNPLMDEHVIYFLVFVGLSFSDAGGIWGLGKWWAQTGLVKKWPLLK